LSAWLPIQVFFLLVHFFACRSWRAPVVAWPSSIQTFQFSPW
jgi:hypothetical protein